MLKTRRLQACPTTPIAKHVPDHNSKSAAMLAAIAQRLERIERGLGRPDKQPPISEQGTILVD